MALYELNCRTLDKIIDDAERIFYEAKKSLRKWRREFYDENNLELEKIDEEKNADVMIKGLKGDIYAKVLGFYIKNILGAKVKYEQEIPCTKKVADLIIDGKISIEVKSRGMHGNESKACERFTQILAKNSIMKHCIVGFGVSPARHKKLVEEFEDNKLPIKYFIMSTNKQENKRSRCYDQFGELISFIKDAL